jgi:hypothetical protein
MLFLLDIFEAMKCCTAGLKEGLKVETQMYVPVCQILMINRV